MSADHPRTVVIAARSRPARERLRRLLGPDDVVVGQACHRWEAGELIRRTGADVALVDVSLLSTAEFFLAGWGAVSRRTRIVAVGPADTELERRLRAAGVADYVVLDAAARPTAA